MRKTSRICQPSPLRNECESVIKANPGITMVGIARLVGEKVVRIDHLVRRLGEKGLVIIHRPRGNHAIRKYYHQAHADQVPQDDIFDDCKRLWLGYSVHKVFGAKGKVKLKRSLLDEQCVSSRRMLTPEGRL